MNRETPKPTCIDLFCGCGGFSLGMQRAGFAVLDAIDTNRIATAVFDRNFPAVSYVLHLDRTAFGLEKLAELIWPGSFANLAVDVIAGGTPCECSNSSVAGARARAGLPRGNSSETGDSIGLRHVNQTNEDPHNELPLPG